MGAEEGSVTVKLAGVSVDGGNPGIHPVTLCGYGIFHGQTPLAGGDHRPVEKWPLS